MEHETKSCKGCPNRDLPKSLCAPGCEIIENYNRVKSDYMVLGEVKVVDRSSELEYPKRMVSAEIDEFVKGFCREKEWDKSRICNPATTKKGKKHLRPQLETLSQAIKKKFPDITLKDLAKILGVPLGSLWTYLHPEKRSPTPGRKKSKKTKKRVARNKDARSNQRALEKSLNEIEDKIIDHNDESNMVILDFTDHSDLLALIKKCAKPKCVLLKRI